jgi:4-hydroxythreonine-4-phosphate dehydrogenase
MMLIGGGLRVALATIHVPLMQVSRALTTDHLVRVARITHEALQRDFGFSEPRLAFSGLNPHAGESGTIGREEIDIINPAAESLRREGIRISDARSGDTVFAEMRRGDFDGVIAMTHDQGLIPVKTLDLWGGVNVTLGLPIIRTSPDHGTAYDAAARGDCTPESLITAIRTAREMGSHRVRVSA